MKRSLLLPSIVILYLFTAGCSVRTFAINKIGDSIASSGTTFASDDDLQLIRDAVPFSLKLMESLLAETPRHRGLLLAASRAFTQYAYAFVQQDADEMEERDLAAANLLHDRARRLYLRARGYALRGLEVKYPDFEKALRQNPIAAAAKVRSAAEVPLLYWTAASWGAAIAISKDDPDLIADQPVVEALIDRALLLDEKFESGAIHGFLISYEPVRQGAKEDPASRSQKHFERELELTEGKLISPLVSFAETISISKQDRAQFELLLKRALDIDPGIKPEWKLENLVMQRRARWLLSRMNQLFVEEDDRVERN